MLDETRIDRWLAAVRLVKTRPAATQLCEGGHVQVNGRDVKPATRVGSAIASAPASPIATGMWRSSA